MPKVFVACVLLLFSSLGLAETRDVHSFFFNQKFGDFKADLDTARQQGKSGILLMYQQAGCPFCRRMENTVLNQSQVQDYYRKHFLIFNIDIRGDIPMTDFKGKETTEKAFSAVSRVRATPTFIFYDLSGNQTARFTGVSKDAGEFLLLGRYVVDGAYKRLPFARYEMEAGR
jgi:thioredoxin-related protein